MGFPFRHYLGNSYGVSWNAQSSAEEILSSLSVSQWKYYFDECFPTDRLILEKIIHNDKPKNRAIDLYKKYGLTSIESADPLTLRFLQAIGCVFR